MILAPFAFTIVNSFKRNIDIYAGALTFPPTLNNYEKLLAGDVYSFMTPLLNSSAVASASTVLALAVAMLAAYSLSRLPWPRLIPVAILGTMVVVQMVPSITFVGPWYLMFRSLGLYGRSGGLIVAHLALNLPMALLLLISFLDSIPREIEEAAVIDGCTHLAALSRIILPLMAPGLVAAGLLAFLFSWNEFAVAVNLTTSGTATLPVAIARNAQEWTNRDGQLAAGAVLAALPAIAAIVFGLRFIVRGLTLGAVK